MAHVVVKKEREKKVFNVEITGGVAEEKKRGEGIRVGTYTIGRSINIPPIDKNMRK